MKTSLIFTIAFLSLAAPAHADSASGLLSSVQNAINTTNSTINTANSGAALVKRVTQTTTTTTQKPATVGKAPEPKTVEKLAANTQDAQAVKAEPTAANSTVSTPLAVGGQEMNLITHEPATGPQLSWLKAHPIPKEGCAEYLTKQGIQTTLAARPKPRPGPAFVQASRAWEGTSGAVCYQRMTGGFDTGVKKDPTTKTE